MARTYIPKADGTWWEVTVDVDGGLLLTLAPGYVPPPDPFSSITAGDIVRGALRLLGAKSSNEQVSASEMQDALYSLNSLIDSWNTEALMVYTMEHPEFQLSAGKQTYSMGPGADWDVDRPLQIEHAYVKLAGGLEFEIPVVEDAEWGAISLKSMTSSFPYKIHNHGDYPQTQIAVWPIPTGACSITLYSWNQMRKFNSATDMVVLPPGYERALRYGLAIEIAPEYAKEPSPTVVEVYRTAKANVKRLNLTPSTMRCDESLTGGSSSGWVNRLSFLTGGMN